jgi:single-stranded DNA-specific DHH superfamily exonuclease
MSEDLSQYAKNATLFKRYLKHSLMLSPEGEKSFEEIPYEYFVYALENNFSGNTTLAKNIFFDNFDLISYKEINKKLSEIQNYRSSIEKLYDYIKSEKKILMIGDSDRDGKASIAIIMDLKNINKKIFENITTSSTQKINGKLSKGLSLDAIDKYCSEYDIEINEDFLIVTADNGINARNEQLKIQNKYKNSNILITDHHIPKENNVILENSRTTIFNPKYNPTEYFKDEKNISGAHVLALVVMGACEKLGYQKEDFDNIKKLYEIANYADYVNSDIVLKPLQKHEIEKSIEILGLIGGIEIVDKIITNEVEKKDIDNIQRQANGINIDRINNSIISIQEQNLKAYKMLNIYNNYKDSDNELKNVNEDILESLIGSNEDFDSSKNYLLDLSYIVLYESINKYANEYSSELLENMKKTFSSTNRSINTMKKELRKSEGLVSIIKGDFSTIMYTKDEKIHKVFSRKMLMTAFNEEQNGFFAFLSKTNNNKMTGIFRGLSNTRFFENLINSHSKVKADFIGHSLAASISLSKKNISENDLLELNKILERGLEKNDYKAKEQKRYVLVDFTNIDIIAEINEKLKFHLRKFEGVRPLIKISRGEKFLEVPENGKKAIKKVTIGQMLKESKHGYKKIELNFEGDSLQFSVETLRKLADNNFKDYLQLDYIGNNSFTSSGVIRADSINTRLVHRLYSEKSKKAKEIEDFYEENFPDKNNPIINIPRDFIKNHPVLIRSILGNKSYDMLERTIISLIEKTDSTMFVVKDVEADGLGSAPEVNNLGLLVAKISKVSGEKYSLKEWEEITKNMTEKELNNKVKNIKIYNDNVIINRELEFNLISILLIAKSLAILPKATNLTYITQAFNNKHGIIHAKADKFLVDHFKNENVIMLAHNSGYDTKASFSNFPLFSKETISKSIILDTAKFSKSEKLAYPDMIVSNFGGASKSAYFFDDNISEDCFSSLLAKGEDFKIPDIKGDYLFKQVDSEYFLVDLRKNETIHIDKTQEEIIDDVNRVRGAKLNPYSISGSSTKYSVVELTNFNLIKKMILSRIKNNYSGIETPVYLKNLDSKSSELFQEYLENYRFDNTPVTNLNNFKYALEVTDRLDELNFINTVVQIPSKTQVLKSGKPKMIKFEFGNFFIDGANEFLQKNKELYIEYAKAWEYKKILSLYDPYRKPSIDKIKSVAYLSGFSPERVNEVFNLTLEYKQKNGIIKKTKDGELITTGALFIEELHSNLNKESDVVLECIVTFDSLLEKTRNPYLKNINTGIDSNPMKTSIGTTLSILLKSAKTTTEETLRSYMTIKNGMGISINGFTHAQMSAYIRKDEEGNSYLSEGINNLLSKKADLVELNGDIIPSGNYIRVNGGLKQFDDIERKNIIDVIGILVIGHLCVIGNSSFDVKDVKKEIKRLTLENPESLKRNNEIEMLNKHKFKILDKLKSLIESKEIKDKNLVIQDHIIPVMIKLEDALKEKIGDFYFTKEKMDFKEASGNIWQEIQGSGVLSLSKLNYLTQEHINQLIELTKDYYPNQLSRFGFEIDSEKVNDIVERLKNYQPIKYTGIIDSLDMNKKDINKLLVDQGFNIEKIILNQQLRESNEINSDFIHHIKPETLILINPTNKGDLKSNKFNIDI